MITECRYLPVGQRVSHFRPWLDSIRWIWMNIRLLARAMAPWPHKKTWSDGAPDYWMRELPPEAGDPVDKGVQIA